MSTPSRLGGRRARELRQQPFLPDMATPPGPAIRQHPGYGHAPVGSQGARRAAPTSQQTIGWITFAIIGLLGLLGAVLTLTLWINLDSAINRASRDV